MRYNYINKTVVHSISIILFTIAPIAHINANESATLRVVNKAFAGIIQAAGNLGGERVCKISLPNEFCNIVVTPVLNALYDEVPYLRPKKEDPLSDLKSKADTAIQYLQNSQKLQNKMLSYFNQISSNQKTILGRIAELGSTQAEVQASIQSMLLNQSEIKNQLNSVIHKQAREEEILLKTKRNDVDILIRKCELLQTDLENNFWRLESKLDNDDLRKQEKIQKELRSIINDTRYEFENETLDIHLIESHRMIFERILIQLNSIADLRRKILG